MMWTISTLSKWPNIMLSSLHWSWFHLYLTTHRARAGSLAGISVPLECFLTLVTLFDLILINFVFINLVSFVAVLSKELDSTSVLSLPEYDISTVKSIMTFMYTGSLDKVTPQVSQLASRSVVSFPYYSAWETNNCAYVRACVRSTC